MSTAANRRITKLETERNLLGESVALIALEVDYSEAIANTQETDGLAATDIVRAIVIASAQALVDAEMNDATLWQRCEWRDTCYDIALAISMGRKPNVASMVAK